MMNTLINNDIMSHNSHIDKFELRMVVTYENKNLDNWLTPTIITFVIYNRYDAPYNGKK